MSYVIHIWEQPLPVSLADADAIRTRLLREEAPASPRCAALALRLTDRHPDIDATDDEDDAGVWTDGPLARNAQGAVFGIGIQTHALDTVLPWVLQQARTLGLVVLDDQAGQVHLPDGRVLGQPAMVAAQPAVAAKINRAQVLDAFRAGVGPLLAADGYRMTEKGRRYEKLTGAARIQVSVDPESYYDGVHVYVSVGLVVPGRCPQALLDRYVPDGAEFSVRIRDLIASMGPDGMALSTFYESPSYVETPSDLSRLVQRWAALLSDAVLPLMRRCEDLQGLATELNRDDAPFSATRVALLLAAASGRTDLAADAQRLKAAIVRQKITLRALDSVDELLPQLLRR